MSQDRPALTRILLRSRLDYLPSVRTWTGQLQTTSAVRGPAASGRKPCETCRTRGRVIIVRGVARPCAACLTHRGDHGCRYCPTCYGAGWVRAREAAFDEYLGTRIGSERGGGEERFYLNRDIARLTIEINRLKGDEATREGKIDHERYGWEVARANLLERGSYAELDLALELLRDRFPNRHRLVWAADVQQLHPDFLTLGESLVLELDRSVAWIGFQLPDPIKVPAELLPDDLDRKQSLAHGRTAGHDRQRGERNAEIRRLADTEAMSRGQIARQYGLTKRRVQQILAVATGVSG